MERLDPLLFAKSKQRTKDPEKQREIALLEAQVYRYTELLGVSYLCIFFVYSWISLYILCTLLDIFVYSLHTVGYLCVFFAYCWIAVHSLDIFVYPWISLHTLDAVPPGAEGGNM